jgi:hypothetical protein
MHPARAWLLVYGGISLATDGGQVFGGSEIILFFDEEG